VPYQAQPPALTLWMTARKAILAIRPTSMPWALQSTIWARRHLTTDPAPSAHEPQEPVAVVDADISHPHPFGIPKAARSRAPSGGRGTYERCRLGD